MSKRPSDIPILNLEREIIPGLHIRRIDNKPHGSPPIMTAHRDDYFVFLYQQSGRSILSIDFKEVILDELSICCILPGSVHHFNSADKVSGWMLATSSELIDEVVRRILLDSVSGDVFHVNGTAPFLDEIARAIAGYQSNSGKLISVIVTHLVSAFTGIFAQVIKINEKKTLSNRAAAITFEFGKILRNNFKTRKAPSWYASQLNLSLSYLNECVRVTSGIAVSTYIQQEIVLEGKRQLVHTDLSVKEIAYGLGYSDPAYFNRVFQKIVGERPAAFRKRYRK